MKKDNLIENTKLFVKEKLKNAEWWHDYFHIIRVYNNALNIYNKEENPWSKLVVELWALLHDIADSKFYDWDESVWPKVAREFLESQNVEEDIILHIIKIIENISFKWWNFEQKFKSKELDIIQDADRLDALWAIWIARTFNFWGHFWREIYNPDIKPNLNMTKEEYKKSKNHTINHFYEKLLLLKDKMNTKTAKQIAKERHKFMELFLEQFYKEWKGEL